MEHQGKQELQGSAGMALAMLISGSIGLFVVRAGQSPLNVVFYRCAIAFACLLPLCLLCGHVRREHLGLKNLALMVVSGLLMIFNWVLLFKAYPVTSISLATIVYHVNPFIILFAGALFFREQVALSDGLWTLLAFAGVLVIAGAGDAALSTQRLTGLGLVLIATSLYSGAVLMTKTLRAVPPLLIVAVQTLAGAVATFALSGVTAVQPGREQWPFIVALGVVHTAFLYWLIYLALAKIRLSAVAILSFLYPVATIVIDYVVFDHLISAAQAMGAALILLATVGVKLHWKIPLRWRQR